jgi:hypothetical protein
LANGNLVIQSSLWDNTPANINAGAFTFRGGGTGRGRGLVVQRRDGVRGHSLRRQFSGRLDYD